MKSGQSPTLPTRTRSQAEGPAPTHHSVLDQPLQSQRRSRERRELPRPLREGDRDGNKRCLRERISGRRWAALDQQCRRRWTSSAGSSARTRAALQQGVCGCIRCLCNDFSCFLQYPPSCTSSLPFMLLFALWFLGHCTSLPIWQH